jgi:hypothetical protein
MPETLVQIGPPRGFGETMRKDAWWVAPLVTFSVLTAFIVYTTWAAFQGDHYEFGPYLSPLYSPLLPRPSWWPSWLFFSPALLILPFPGGFRFTCYYYRGAYYKSHWADPPSCAVGEPRKSYLGERSFPLILQNVHRWFLYAAIVFIFILGWDAIVSYRFEDGFGIGVGSLVLTVNVILLGGYTFGCHSLRHLVGGIFDQLSRRPLRAKVYDGVSCLNRRHMLWAWVSLVWVAFTDVYVRLCSMGIWHDLRIL